MLHASFKSVPDQTENGPEPVPIVSLSHFTQSFGTTEVLKDVSFDILAKEVLCLAGPVKSGKSTLLRCLCRLNETERGARQSGLVLWRNRSIADPALDVTLLRRKIAMIPPVANPFHASVRENLTYGLGLSPGETRSADTGERIQAALTVAGLWDEVKDGLNLIQAYDLPQAQQRLLCIARSLVLEPDVLMLDELPVGQAGVGLAEFNELLLRLKQHTSVLVVTHSLKTAAAVADRIAHIDGGRVHDVDSAEMVLTNPQNATTQAFVNSYC